MPSTEITEPLRMIEALSLRCGSADCTVKNTLVRLVLMTFSNVSSGGVAERRAAGDTGIGEQDVVFAELVGSLADRGFGGGDVGRVGRERECVRPQFLRCGIERRLIAAA